jgi:hypothetical protein
LKKTIASLNIFPLLCNNLFLTSIASTKAGQVLNTGEQVFLFFHFCLTSLCIARLLFRPTAHHVSPPLPRPTSRGTWLQRWQAGNSKNLFNNKHVVDNVRVAYCIGGHFSFFAYWYYANTWWVINFYWINCQINF